MKCVNCKFCQNLTKKNKQTNKQTKQKHNLAHCYTLTIHKSSARECPEGNENNILSSKNIEQQWKEYIFYKKYFWPSFHHHAVYWKNKIFATSGPITLHFPGSTNISDSIKTKTDQSSGQSPCELP